MKGEKIITMAVYAPDSYEKKKWRRGMSLDFQPANKGKASWTDIDSAGMNRPMFGPPARPGKHPQSDDVGHTRGPALPPCKLLRFNAICILCI